MNRFNLSMLDAEERTLFASSLLPVAISDDEKVLLELALAEGGVYVEEAADELGKSPDAIDRLLKKLLERELVLRVGGPGNPWIATPHGFAATRPAHSISVEGEWLVFTDEERGEAMLRFATVSTWTNVKAGEPTEIYNEQTKQQRQSQRQKRRILAALKDAVEPMTITDIGRAMADDAQLAAQAQPNREAVSRFVSESRILVERPKTAANGFVVHNENGEVVTEQIELSAVVRNDEGVILNRAWADKELLDGFGRLDRPIDVRESWESKTKKLPPSSTIQ